MAVKKVEKFPGFMIYFLKKLYLQELKGMQRSKLGMVKNNHKLCQWYMKW